VIEKGHRRGRPLAAPSPFGVAASFPSPAAPLSTMNIKCVLGSISGVYLS
jgi:hypothetical protein